MKNKLFAEKLHKFMLPRIEELVRKFKFSTYNSATFPAFQMGNIGDIESFLKDNKLFVRKSEDLIKKNNKLTKEILDRL